MTQLQGDLQQNFSGCAIFFWGQSWTWSFMFSVVLLVSWEKMESWRSRQSFWDVNFSHSIKKKIKETVLIYFLKSAGVYWAKNPLESCLTCSEAAVGSSFLQSLLNYWNVVTAATGLCCSQACLCCTLAGTAPERKPGGRCWNKALIPTFPVCTLARVCVCVQARVHVWCVSDRPGQRLQAWCGRKTQCLLITDAQHTTCAVQSHTAPPPTRVDTPMTQTLLQLPSTALCSSGPK